MEWSEYDSMKAFMHAFRGIPGHKVAKAMTKLQHGIDFTGCSKSLLAETWASRNSPLGHKELRNVTLLEIKNKIIELYAGSEKEILPTKKATVKVKSSRELFEEWIKKVRPGMDLTLFDTLGEYQNIETYWLWDAWQAGRRSL